MAYNFRKEQKELYVPGKSPSLINVPAMKYLTVRGHGDPNQENSEYKKGTRSYNQLLVPFLLQINYFIQLILNLHAFPNHTYQSVLSSLQA